MHSVHIHRDRLMNSPDKAKLREYLHWVNSLLASMDASVRSAGESDIWKHASYKKYARKYNQVIDEIGRNVQLPPILDVFDLDRIPGGGDTVIFQQREIFDAVHVNASLLKGFLESKIGVVEDETVGLRDFLEARLRSAMLKLPERERDVQDAVETLLIGRGYQKGLTYDREVGRVKVSVKEVIPDFILPRLGLALEIKLSGSVAKVKAIVDEINADIRAYGKEYRSLLFVVYDLGHIRDEAEFRQDLERWQHRSDCSEALSRRGCRRERSARPITARRSFAIRRA
jgi:hypothetical protein